MEYSNTFIVEVNSPRVRGKLAKQGKPGKPTSLDTIIIFKTNLSRAEVEAIKGVISVEEETFDSPFSITQVQKRPPSWFLPSASNSVPDYHFIKTGQGVAIYIMDSGIRIDHDEFSGRDISTVFSHDGLDYGGDVLGPDHGTMAASCAAGNVHGIAKGATIFNVRYNWSSIEGIKALDTILTHHRTHVMPSVLSMSFGSYSNIYDSAYTQLANEGVVMVAAAGNFGDDHAMFPARRRDVIAVAACNSRLEPSVWSGGQSTNYGPEVDIWAGGTDGIAASGSSQFASQWAGGTSSACPLVAGKVALILEGFSKLINYQEVLDTKMVLLESARKDVIKYPDPKYRDTPNRYIFTMGVPFNTTPPDVEPIPDPEPTPIPPDEDVVVDGPESDEKSSNLLLILGAVAVIGLLAILLI